MSITPRETDGRQNSRGEHQGYSGAAEARATANLAGAYHALHRTTDSQAALERPKRESAYPIGLAYVYATLDQTDDAFQWLDRAYVEKSQDLCYLKGHPFLKKLEGDPRYKAFLRKMNLPP